MAPESAAVEAATVADDPASTVALSAERRAAAHAQANELLARAELRRVTHGGTRLGIAADAGDLGVIRIDAVDRGDGLQLNLGSDRSSTRTVLAEHLQELRDELRADGFDLGSLDVGTGRGNPDRAPAERVPADHTRSAPPTATRPAPAAIRPASPVEQHIAADGIDLRL